MADTLTAKIEFNDLVRFLKHMNYEEDVAVAVADYLTECIDYEFELSQYIWNTLLFNVVIVDSKKEALQYIKENLCCDVEDCIIYETCNNKCYLEWN